MRHSYLFSRFLITALVAATPLVAMHSWTLFRELRAAQERAYSSVQQRALSTATALDMKFEVYEKLLLYLARHPAIMSLDHAACDKVLNGIEQVGPATAGLAVLDPSGHAVCLTYPLAKSAPHDAAGSPWFETATASKGFYLGQPALGRITRRPVAPLSHVVRDARGSVVALAVLSIDLLEMQALMLKEWDAKDSVLAVLNSDFQFLIRTPNTEAWFGRTASETVRTMPAPVGGSVATGIGTEGLERVYGAAPVGRQGLRVVAAIPAEHLLGLAHDQIRNAFAVAGAAALLAGALAVLGAKALGRPMRSLAISARAFFAGDRNARADESLPGEFRELAVEMNSMYVARLASEKSAQLSENRIVRLSRFYEASSRANQAMSRIRDADDLYRTVCQLCVETGQATMAWIALFDHGAIAPVAWGGPAKIYTSSLASAADALPPPLSDTVNAVLRGENRVLNDYLGDPNTEGSRLSAASFGIRSLAVVPFRRAGVVVGILNLYAGEVGFFDVELMHLLTELATDVSFTLDNIDRENAFARTTAVLAKREAQLSGIVDSAMVAIVTIDRSQRIIVFNKAAAEMFQIPMALALGRTPDMFMPERFRQAHYNDVVRYMNRRDDAKENAEPPRHLVGLRSSGEEFPLELSTFRAFDAAEVLVTLVMRDISAERDAEQSRIIAAESQAANRAKTDFLSRMSHELRTPLNAVLSFSQLLQEGARDRLNETERHQLDLIFLAGAQLGALVDDVLDVSVIESGQMSLSLVDFELSTLLDGVMRMSEAAARVSDIELKPVYRRSSKELMHTDPIRLRQVMLNLMSNAIKYNRPGGEVSLEVDSTESGVCISVIDSGIGMTADQLARIFEPFNRLGREHSNVEGTGIGMTLVRQLVELMGGTVTVTSAVRVGTKVQVVLPRARAADVLSQTFVPPVRSDSGDSASGPSGLVLYVEDNPVNVLIVKSVLSRWPDVQLVIAVNGESGIAEARALLPDVLLLDMRLPDMSGLDLLRTLRASPKTADLRVIALSASAMPEEVSEARAAGAWDYWTKPIHVESFCKGLASLLVPARRAG